MLVRFNDTLHDRGAKYFLFSPQPSIKQHTSHSYTASIRRTIDDRWRDTKRLGRTSSMSKTKTQSKNIFPILLGLLITMVSIAEASTFAVGEWKLKEVWRENAAEPLSITRDGESYIMKIYPAEEKHPDSHRFSIKVGNSMSSSMKIVEEEGNKQKINIGFVMSTRMMPGSEEKRELEGYLSDQLPKMTSIRVKGEGEELVLSSESGARMVCAPSTESEN